MSEANTPGETKPGFGSGVNPEGDNQKTNSPEPASLSLEEMERILKRDAHAQAHIERLEAEAREREEMLTSLQSQVEEFNVNAEEQRKLEQFQQARINANANTESTENSVDADDIVMQVQAKLEQQSLERQAQSNYETAVAWANEVFGSEFEQRVAERSHALGMTVEDTITLASKSPEAFKNLFAPKGYVPPTATGESGLNSQGVAQEVSQNAQAGTFLNNYRQQGFRALGTREAFEAFRNK